MRKIGRRQIHRHSPERRRELRRQWIAAGVVSTLTLVALFGLFWRQHHPPPIDGPFPTRRINDRPLPFDPEAVPGRLRVLRAGKPYRTKGCVALFRGRCVESMSMEEYVRGVVVGEEGVFERTIDRPTFGAGAGLTLAERRRRVTEAWKLQAIAARSYAIYAVIADKHHLKKTGFHITDTIYDQVYVDRRSDAVSRAVEATSGQVLVDRRGRLVHALYSACCGGRGTRSVLPPNEPIACHPECHRYAFRKSSHYVGMCQWGSLLFAMEGHPADRLAARYYPKAKIRKIRYR